MSLLEVYEMFNHDEFDENIDDTTKYIMSVAKTFGLCPLPESYKAVHVSVNGKLVPVADPVDEFNVKHLIVRLLNDMYSSASTMKSFYQNIDGSKDAEIKHLREASENIKQYVKNYDIWDLNLSLLISKIPNFIYLNFDQFKHYGDLILFESNSVTDLDKYYIELCESLSILIDKKNKYYSRSYISPFLYRTYDELYPDECNRKEIILKLINRITLYYLSNGFFDKINLVNDNDCIGFIKNLIKDGDISVIDKPYIDRFYKLVDDEIVSINSIPESIMTGYRFKGE